MLCYAKCETLTFSFIGAVLTMMTRAQAQRDSEVSNEISSVLKMNVYVRALLNKVQNFFFFFSGGYYIIFTPATQNKQ